MILPHGHIQLHSTAFGCFIPSGLAEIAFILVSICQAGISIVRFYFMHSSLRFNDDDPSNYVYGASDSNRIDNIPDMHKCKGIENLSVWPNRDCEPVDRVIDWCVCFAFLYKESRC